jgi:hypothetical protein
MLYIIWLLIALMLATLGIIVRDELMSPDRGAAPPPAGDASNALG